jgi:hypothetical protein
MSSAGHSDHYPATRSCVRFTSSAPLAKECAERKSGTARSTRSAIVGLTLAVLAACCAAAPGQPAGLPGEPGRSSVPRPDRGAILVRPAERAATSWQTAETVFRPEGGEASPRASDGAGRFRPDPRFERSRPPPRDTRAGPQTSGIPGRETRGRFRPLPERRSYEDLYPGPTQAPVPPGYRPPAEGPAR